MESEKDHKWVESGEGRSATGGWSQETGGGVRREMRGVRGQMGGVRRGQQRGGVRSGQVSGRWRPESTDAVRFTVLNL